MNDTTNAAETATDAIDGRRVHSTRLDTGTRLIVIHDPSARNVSVSLAVPAGMRHEAPGEEGMLHLLEHMVYQDSKEITASEREAAMHKAGGILGGNTHMDYSEFYESGQIGHLEHTSRRLVEQVFNPALKDGHLAEQIRAVATERARRLDRAPGGILPWPHLTARHWKDHPNSHDGTGDLDLTGRATPDKLRDIHRRLYRPSAAVMTAVTPEDPHLTLKKMALPFSEVSDNGYPAPILRAAVPSVGPEAASRVGGVMLTRRLSATVAAPAQTVGPDLLGDLLAAEVLTQQAGLDASAGLFGPGDMTRDDLFVLVDDTGQAINPSDRLRALAVADDTALLRAAQRAILRTERFTHDDERLARTVTRDALLRGTPMFAAELVSALAAICEDVARIRPVLERAATRLANQQSVSLTVPSAQEASQ